MAAVLYTPGVIEKGCKMAVKKAKYVKGLARAMYRMVAISSPLVHGRSRQVGKRSIPDSSVDSRRVGEVLIIVWTGLAALGI